MLRWCSDPVVNAALFGNLHLKAESCVRRGPSCVERAETAGEATQPQVVTSYARGCASR